LGTGTAGIARGGMIGIGAGGGSPDGPPNGTELVFVLNPGPPEATPDVN
jgi:hypothetical protein